jgi:hypothetical protein
LDGLVLLELGYLGAHVGDYLFVGGLHGVELGDDGRDLGGGGGGGLFDGLEAFNYLGVLMPNLTHFGGELVFV